MWVDREKKQSKKIEKKNEAQGFEKKAQQKWKDAKMKREGLELELENLRKQIDSLDTENKEVEDKLRTRETDLYKYRFKIKDLNKSKQVLTHRTYEMRANLEPKD